MTPQPAPLLPYSAGHRPASTAAAPARPPRGPLTALPAHDRDHGSTPPRYIQRGIAGTCFETAHGHISDRKIAARCPDVPRALLTQIGAERHTGEIRRPRPCRRPHGERLPFSACRWLGTRLKTWCQKTVVNHITRAVAPGELSKSLPFFAGGSKSHTVRSNGLSPRE